MVQQLNEYFMMRRKLNLTYAESAAALTPEREQLLSTNSAVMTSDDKVRMETFAGQRERDRKAAQEAAKAAYRRYWGA